MVLAPSLTRLQFRYQPWLQSSEGLIEAPRSTSKIAYSHGFWKEEAVPCLWTSPQHCSIVLTTLQLASSRSADAWEQSRSHIYFRTQTGKTQSFPQSYWLHMLGLSSVGGDYTRMWMPGGRITDNCLDSWSHTWLLQCSTCSWHSHMANLDAGRADGSLPRALFCPLPPTVFRNLFVSLSPHWHLQLDPIVCHWASSCLAL